MSAPALRYLALLLGACGLPGLVGLAGPAQAGTRLEFETREGNATGRVTVAVQEGRVRIDQGGGAWMLYDSGKNSVSLVEPQRRSYVELTREELRRYGQQLGAARKLLDEQLPGLLPEQRAAIEKMMGGAARREPLLFQPTGQKRKVSGYPCSMGRLVRRSEVQEEACIAAPADIGMPKTDYASVRSMYQLMHEMQELGAPGILPDLSEIDGIPIEVRNPSGDLQRIRKASNEKLPAENFAMPAGYARENVLEALQRYR